MSGSWLSSIYKLWCPVCFVMTHLRWNFPKTSFRLPPCCCFVFFSLPSLNIFVSYMHQQSHFSWIHRGCVSPFGPIPLVLSHGLATKEFANASLNSSAWLWFLKKCEWCTVTPLRSGFEQQVERRRKRRRRRRGGVLAVVVRSAFRVCASLNWGHAQKRGGGGEGGPL